jgi:RHS repeat-associated protein
LIASDTTSPYSVSWAAVPAGSYSVTAKVTTNLGLTTTSVPVTVNVAAVPTIILTAPANATSVGAGSNVTLIATATSATGQAITKVDFYQGATLLGTSTSAPYSYVWSNVAAGNYSLTAKATDSLGSISSSTPISFTVNTLPTVSLTSPLANATMNAPGNFTIIAAAASTGSTVSKVEFFADGILINTATTAPYTYQWSNVATGSYSLVAVVTDALGNAAISTTVTITVTPGVVQAYYIHTDQIDTPRQITNVAGQVVWQWDNSDAFGANLPNQNPLGQGTFTYNPRFAGQYFDKETNTHYNYFRDCYDPATGRYCQSDPIGLRGGINTYTYVNGKPISKTDPMGLIEWNGTSTSAGIGKNGETRYTLTSECLKGYQTEVVVEVVFFSFGGGASWTTSGASFTDKFDYVNPYVFDGPAFNVSAGAAAKWGTGYDYTVMGGASSPGSWSAQQGIGAWAGVSFGKSTVISSKSTPCSCPTH